MKQHLQFKCNIIMNHKKEKKNNEKGKNEKR